MNETAPPPAEFAYDAFASHATDPDGALVRRVEAVLESFHRRRGLPLKYTRELQLCVDGRDFVFPRRQGGSIGAIEPIIRAYQEKSRSLLVFSGTLSVDHPWINHEIECWAEERPDGPVYFALTHGMDPTVPDIYLPRALRDRGGPDNFIFYDLRGFYRQRDFVPSFARRVAYSAREAQLRREADDWRSVRSFDEELTKLAAQLVSDATGASIPVSELVTAYAEVERRDRLWRRTSRAVIAMVVSSLIGILVWVASGLLAEQQRQKLASWEQEATLLSTSSGPGLLDALVYAASAVRDGDDPAGLEALYNILPRIIPVDQTIQPLAGERSSEQTQTAALIRQDTWLATGGRDGVLYVNDAVTGAAIAELPLHCGRIRSILSLPGDDLIAIASDRGLRFVSVSMTAHGTRFRDAGTLLDGARVAAVAANERGTLYVGELYGKLWRFDPEASGEKLSPHYRSTFLGVVMDPRDASLETPSSVFGMAMRGTSLIVGGIDGVLTVFEISKSTTTLPPVIHQIVHPASIFAMDVTRDGSTIAVADDAGDIYLYNGDLTNPRHAELQIPDPASLNQHIDGSWATAPVDQVPAVGVAFDPDGFIVAATGHDHTVKFFLASNLRLIGTDVHAAATRGVVFAASGGSAYTFGDDGVINRVEPLKASPFVRIGDVEGFAPAFETAQIAYWVKPANGLGKVFAIQPDMAQPGVEVGELSYGGGWGGIAFGPHSVLVRLNSVFTPELPLTPTGQPTCPTGGLGHPNEPGNVETVERLIRGTRPEEVATVTRPTNDGPSHLRLWSASDCSQQWRHDFDGSPEQASTAADLVGTVEGKTTVRLFAPPAGQPVAEVAFSSEIASLATAPRGEIFAIVTSDRKRLCVCTRAPSDGSQTGDCGAKSASHICKPIAPEIDRLNGQIEFSASGRYLIFGYGSAGLALAQAAKDWQARRIAPPQVRQVTPPFAFSPGEDLLAVPAGDSKIAVIDPGTFGTRVLLPTPSRVMQLAFLRDGTDRLVSLDGNVLRTWDWSRSLLLREACRRWPVWLTVTDRAAVPSPLSQATVCGRPNSEHSSNAN